MDPYASALSMARAIQEGSVTSRQLVEMYIARIERMDGAALNAVIDRDFKGALLCADRADKQWRDAQTTTGEKIKLGVFHGVPMTIKEGILAKGFRMTDGDPLLKLFRIPKWFSHEHARLMIEEGGAIVIGKTNLPLNQCDWETNNPVYGRTGNPYDITRSPGGSSGGAAAALAAGLTPMELGSDIGGSIRVPAVLCGVVGHCPTRGVLPSWLDIHYGRGCGGGCLDRLARKLLDPIVWMARIGPMARTVEDVVAMLEVLGGDVAESLCRPKKDSRLLDYRIAVWRSHDISPPGQEVRRALDKVVLALQAVGVTVDELKPPMDPMETYTLYLRYLGPFCSFLGMHMPKEQKQNAKRGRAKDSFPSDIRSPFWEMDYAGVNGIPEGTQEAYENAANTWDDYLKTHYDVVLCPIFPCEAWPNASGPRDSLSDAKVLSRKLVVDGEDRYYGDALFWPHLSVLLGLPAAGFPVGFTQTCGLPVGLQAMGPKGNDFIILDVVQKLMEALGTNKFQPPPGFA